MPDAGQVANYLADELARGVAVTIQTVAVQTDSAVADDHDTPPKVAGGGKAD